jgi:hypothetical protein
MIGEHNASSCGMEDAYQVEQDEQILTRYLATISSM